MSLVPHTPLAIVSVYPLHQQGGLSTRNDLVITFSVPIKAGSGKITIATTAFPREVLFIEDVATSTRIRISGNTLSFDLPDGLTPGGFFELELQIGAVVNANDAFDTLAYNQTLPFQVELAPAAAPMNWTGTEGADTMHGSDSADVMHGGAAPDALYGHAGDDLLRGGDEPYEGLDPNGAAPGDSLVGMDGDDTLLGEGGSDYLYGGTGNDTLFGGADHDYLNGEHGDDLVVGGSGDDTISISEGADKAYGEAGNDSIEAYSQQACLLDGGDGNDSLLGMGASHTLLGGAGNDHLSAGSSSAVATVNLTLDGGSGDDRLSAFSMAAGETVTMTTGEGRDEILLFGNKGDVIVTDFTAGDGGDQVDLLYQWREWTGNPFALGLLTLEQRGADTVIHANTDTSAPLLVLKGVDLRMLTRANFVDGIDPLGSDRGLVINGADGADTLVGGVMGDTLAGGGGADRLSGFHGNDTLDGGADADQLLGGTGADTLSGGDDADVLDGEAGDDILRGDAGNDVLRDAWGNNTLDGGDGDDQLTSSGVGLNYLVGGAGNDVLKAGAGDDTVDGGSGDDLFSISNEYPDETSGHPVTIIGGEGNDRIDITLGMDRPTTVTVAGGAGVDTYSFTDISAKAHINITDFTGGTGGDSIALESLLGDGYAGGNPFGPTAVLRLLPDGADTLLMHDPDGNHGPRPFYEVVRFIGLPASAFTAANFAGNVAPDGAPGGMVLEVGPNGGRLVGGLSNDTLLGGEHGDNLVGNAGDDQLTGGGGGDVLIAGTGDDILDGGNGSDILDGGQGDDTLRGGDGDDQLLDREGVNLLDGGAGNDTLYAVGGGGRYDGGAGNDQLSYSASAHGAGAVLAGGDGEDWFYVTGIPGASAIITASGGAGVDRFALQHVLSAVSYTVNDFSVGSGGDMLHLAELVQVAPGGPNPFASGYLALAQAGADTLVRYSVAGDATGANGVTVLRLAGVEAASITTANIVAGFDPHATPTASSILDAQHQSHLQGTAGNDRLAGTTASEVISGGAGNDILSGDGGADLLRGGEGNDLFYIGQEANLVSGGAGDDTVRFVGPRASYTIRQGTLGMEVSALPGGINATRMDGVERLAFADQGIAFDVDGTAGQVFRLYQAAFDRSPDLVGMGYWLSRTDRGDTLEQLAQAFVTSAEFSHRYSAATNYAAIVTAFYANVLDRSPDAAGLAYWVELLERQTASLSSVLVSFSESAENQSNVAALVGMQIEYVPFAA